LLCLYFCIFVLNDEDKYRYKSISEEENTIESWSSRQWQKNPLQDFQHLESGQAGVYKHRRPSTAASNTTPPMSDAGVNGRRILGGLIDVAGIRDPEPTVGMQVMISETGRAICQAHCFFCPDSEVGKGTIDKVMDGQVQVKWEVGKDGAYLCGKYDQYMLVAATTTSTDVDS